MKETSTPNFNCDMAFKCILEMLSGPGSSVGIATELRAGWPGDRIHVVANGIRQALMSLTKHIPSHLTIEGHRVLISYEGQPTTCYGCGEIGHLYPNCPKK
jgi:hypothetical protein